MKILSTVIDFFERKPSLGYVTGAISAFPGYLMQAEAWLKFFGTAIGCLVGVVTLCIQLRVWIRGRRTS